jgi:hypothetical protein
MLLSRLGGLLSTACRTLLDALFTLNLEAQIVLYAGVAFSNLIQQLFDFIQWLKVSVCFLRINEMTPR